MVFQDQDLKQFYSNNSRHNVELHNDWKWGVTNDDAKHMSNPRLTVSLSENHLSIKPRRIGSDVPAIWKININSTLLMTAISKLGKEGAQMLMLIFDLFNDDVKKSRQSPNRKSYITR